MHSTRGTHRPVDGVEVHRAGRHACILAARLAHHAVGALLGGSKLGGDLVSDAILLLRRPRGQRVEGGLQSPQAREEVADEDEADELLDDGELRMGRRSGKHL